MEGFSPTKKRKANDFYEPRILINDQVILGRGGFSIIFLGSIEDRAVAVKRIQTANLVDTITREEDALKKLDHENIIKLYHAEYRSNNEFRCFALELCAASMDKLFFSEEDEKKYRGPRPNKKDGIFQMANGLAYLHEQSLMHRDIKPQNILISNNINPVLKWADFGFVKAVTARGTHSFRSGINCTQEWAAPEILNLLRNHHPEDLRQRGTIKSDIFSAGMVFFCWLTDGIHPFGDSSVIIGYNIIFNNVANMSSLSDNHFFYRILRDGMMNPIPEERTDMKEIKERAIEFLSRTEYLL